MERGEQPRSVSPLLAGEGSGVRSFLSDAYLPDGLLRVQAAAARLAAARADLVAVLGLPRHYRPAEALEHRRTLADLLDRGGSSTSSYTALYHPWIVVREAGGTLRRSGPEGAACGTIAARTLARGAWVAPANQVIRNALALDPAPSSEEQAVLYDAAINVLGQGQTYVFAPHSPAFRRRVKTGFDRHLAGMFARGAFAGNDPALVYQVVVDESVNPPSAVEQGRLVVELKVAPSQPLTYIVVRLIQSGPGTVTVQEV